MNGTNYEVPRCGAFSTPHSYASWAQIFASGSCFLDNIEDISQKRSGLRRNLGVQNHIGHIEMFRWLTDYSMSDIIRGSWRKLVACLWARSSYSPRRAAPAHGARNTRCLLLTSNNTHYKGTSSFPLMVVLSWASSVAMSLVVISLSHNIPGIREPLITHNYPNHFRSPFKWRPRFENQANQIRLTKTCLDGTQSKVRIGNYLFCSFPIENGLK